VPGHGLADLAQVLRHLPPATDPNLLSGFAHGADAAIYRLTHELAVVQTVDYITPVVDDPFAFGAIAAANALSDLYAMGARPVLALNLVGFPVKTLPLGMLDEILRGGAAKLAEAGASLGGGHSIEDLEPKYGLAATGLVHPDRLITNAGARPGDVLILTKPLGAGLITTGIDRGLVSPPTIERVTAVMTQLNRAAAEAMLAVGVQACTDVSGFGLLGHLREMVEASGVGARLRWKAVPVLAEAWDLAAQDCVPDGTRNNLNYLADFVDWGRAVAPAVRTVLCDAQTSGGLLMAAPAERAGKLLKTLHGAGVGSAAVIGEITRRPVGRIRVTGN
jgi:selenide,water dikinase